MATFPCPARAPACPVVLSSARHTYPELLSSDAGRAAGPCGHSSLRGSCDSIPTSPSPFLAPLPSVQGRDAALSALPPAPGSPTAHQSLPGTDPSTCACHPLSSVWATGRLVLVTGAGEPCVRSVTTPKPCSLGLWLHCTGEPSVGLTAGERIAAKWGRDVTGAGRAATVSHLLPTLHHTSTHPPRELWGPGRHLWPGEGTAGGPCARRPTLSALTAQV